MSVNAQIKSILRMRSISKVCMLPLGIQCSVPQYDPFCDGNVLQKLHIVHKGGGGGGNQCLCNGTGYTSH